MVERQKTRTLEEHKGAAPEIFVSLENGASAISLALTASLIRTILFRLSAGKCSAFARLPYKNHKTL
jgi:hypothetical protein